MKASEDAFGQFLSDCQRGKHFTEIIERDDGLIEAGPGCKMYFSPFEEWLPAEQQAIQMVHGSVLDIGSGAGRHALYLQRKGHDVLCLDNSPLSLQVCRERGVKQTRLMSITQISSELGIFDTVIMMGNNFGLMSNTRRAKWLLRRFYSILSDDGRIVASSLDPYATNEPAHLAYHEQNRKRGRMSGQVRIRVRYKMLKTPWFDYLFVSKDELRDLLNNTGWHISTFIDSERGYFAIIDKS